MKYGFICLLLISFAFSSCNHLFRDKSVKGDGNVIIQAREVGHFTGIEVSSALQVVLSTDTTSVRVETDSNLQPYIEVYTKGSTLYVRQKENTSLSSSRSTKVYISALRYDMLRVSGACKLSSSDTIIVPGQFTVLLEGASEADMPVKAAVLSLEMDGASKASLNGDVQDLEVNASGSCDLKAFGLSAANVDVKLQGASSAQVYPTAKLIADANGASKVFYKGNVAPAYTLNGASSISKVD